MRRLRVSLREMILLIVIVALSLGWWRDTQRIECELERTRAAEAGRVRAFENQRDRMQKAANSIELAAFGFGEEYQRLDELETELNVRTFYPRAVSQMLPFGHFGIRSSPGTEGTVLGSGRSAEAAWKAAWEGLPRPAPRMETRPPGISEGACR
jgi:hypothetical protein